MAEINVDLDVADGFCEGYLAGLIAGYSDVKSSDGALSGFPEEDDQTPE